MKEQLLKNTKRSMTYMRGETMKIDVTNATLNILMEIDGKIHLIAVKKDKYETISFFVKSSIEYAIPTDKTQVDLLKFLNYKG